ncbi:condensation domain-containing protein [Lactococcus sp. NH2-7C]|uniref:condensation domain-containing protein n=1 Tax=Lactococcus sp. NH2-7C TaxID=2879149 RepID=UPI001CDB6A5E|nr:condensation domain-containing protein [Lactococcus sp. NH2-7C]MCA2390918.1 condensation domain-containing protein [Lactococcus sp. NH2-7C]WGV29732.1 condensation domain-containing protein [Lactococcus sp. NH2-7C]
MIKQELNSKITVKEIFEAKTIRKIAEILEENNNKSKSTEGRLIVTKQEFLSVQDQKLSVGQKTYRQLPVNSYSNVKIAFRLKEGIDEKRLAKAITRVVQHQEILRTKIFDNYQVVDDGNLAITHNNVNRSDYFAHRFDLTKEIPIKANIYEGIFTCVIDHVAFDGWSTSLFLSEIESAYFEKGLPNLPFQFKDFSKCQSEFLSSSKKSKQIEFWKEKLSEYMPIKFGDKKESKNKSVGGGDEYLHLDNHLYQRIIDITKEGEHTLHDILLGTFYLLLKKISGDEIVSIAIPTVNRSVEGTENLIGSFINQFLLPMRVSGDDTVELFLNRLSETVLAAQDNQDIPLETVIQELGIKLGGNSVYFGIQGFKGEALKNSQIFEPISEMNQQSVKDAFCDLTIFVWGQDINFNYNSREFSEERIEEIKRIYEDVLKKIVNNFDYKIKEIIRD